MPRDRRGVSGKFLDSLIPYVGSPASSSLSVFRNVAMRERPPPSNVL